MLVQITVMRHMLLRGGLAQTSSIHEHIGEPSKGILISHGIRTRRMGQTVKGIPRFEEDVR